MDAAHDARRQLGQLMVDEGFLTVEQLSRALAEQGRTGRPLGAILVELGFVSSGAVANALAEQHGGLLKTEFGISAGLHALLGGDPPAPAAAAPDHAARVHELEGHLREILTERNTFAERINELQARLSEVAKAPEADVALATAAAARVTALEAELQTAHAARNELDTAVRLGATRISELQHEVAELREQAEQRRDEQAAAETMIEATDERAHLLFFPASSGYALVELPGPAPLSGTLLDIDGVGFVVCRVGVSPLPGSRLRCVFLELV